MQVKETPSNNVDAVGEGGGGAGEQMDADEYTVQRGKYVDIEAGGEADGDEEEEGDDGHERYDDDDEEEEEENGVEMMVTTTGDRLSKRKRRRSTRSHGGGDDAVMMAEGTDRGVSRVASEKSTRFVWNDEDVCACV